MTTNPTGMRPVAATEDSPAPLQVEIWSDVVCPWCYLGKHRFELAAAQFEHPVEVTWRSFQLDPQATTSGPGELPAQLAAKYGMPVDQARGMLVDMTARGAAEGVHFDFEAARSANTFDAHRLLQLARERGVANEVKERLVRAYFGEGAAVDDHATLVRLGAEAGLDPQEARSVLADGRYAAEVRADIDEARALGISGVPFFAIDRRFGISGAQPDSVLLQALTQAWAEHVSSGPQSVTPTAQGDICGPDSCEV